MYSGLGMMLGSGLGTKVRVLRVRVRVWVRVRVRVRVGNWGSVGVRVTFCGCFSRATCSVDTSGSGGSMS